MGSFTNVVGKKGLVGRHGESLGVLKKQLVPFYLQLLYTKHTYLKTCEQKVRIIFQETSLSLSLLSLDTIKLTLQPRTICCQRMIYTSYEFGVDFLHINRIQYHDASGELR